MPTNLPKRSAGAKRRLISPDHKQANFVLASLTVPTVLVALITALPIPLVLPAFGISAFLIGTLLGLWAILRRDSQIQVRELQRDAAGFLVLIGFGAFMMTDLASAIVAIGELGFQTVSLAITLE